MEVSWLIIKRSQVQYINIITAVRSNRKPQDSVCILLPVPSVDKMGRVVSGRASGVNTVPNLNLKSTKITGTTEYYSAIFVHFVTEHTDWHVGVNPLYQFSCAKGCTYFYIRCTVCQTDKRVGWNLIWVCNWIAAAVYFLIAVRQWELKAVRMSHH